MIMSFKPEQADRALVDVDMDSSNLTLIKSFVPKPSIGGGSGKYKVSSGTTRGEFAFPESGPLIVPTIDRTAFAVSESGKPLPKDQQTAMKRGKTFISSYLDRRAQAYAGQHGEDSTLAVPGAARSENFASRWAEPKPPGELGESCRAVDGWGGGSGGREEERGAEGAASWADAGEREGGPAGECEEGHYAGCAVPHDCGDAESGGAGEVAEGWEAVGL